MSDCNLGNDYLTGACMPDFTEYTYNEPEKNVFGSSNTACNFDGDFLVNPGSDLATALTTYCNNDLGTANRPYEYPYLREGGFLENALADNSGDLPLPSTRPGEVRMSAAIGLGISLLGLAATGSCTAFAVGTEAMSLGATTPVSVPAAILCGTGVVLGVNEASKSLAELITGKPGNSPAAQGISYATGIQPTTLDNVFQLGAGALGLGGLAYSGYSYRGFLAADKAAAAAAAEKSGAVMSRDSARAAEGGPSLFHGGDGMPLKFEPNKIDILKAIEKDGSSWFDLFKK
jgi:hypothetical protein